MKQRTLKAVEMFSKALRQEGVEDFYRHSFRNAYLTRRIISSPTITPTCFQSSYSNPRFRPHTNNPMLDGGVSMLQWFFDEVRPDQREVRYWMKYFNQRADPYKPFAIMFLTEDVFEQEIQDQGEKKDGSSSRSILETLALSLYFMQQNNMKVILLVGSSHGSDCRLSQKQAVDVRKRIYNNMMTLTERLEQSGTDVSPLFDCGHLFQTDRHSWISSVNKERINWLCRRHSMPIIGCIGEEAETSQMVPISVDETILKLAALTQPLKILMLNSSGGIKNVDGQRITTIFLPRESELQKFMNQLWWNENMEFRFKKICDVLRILPRQSSYVIASASDVLTELLTQRGQGTMFKKVVPVTKYTSMDDIVKTNCMHYNKTVEELLPGIIETAFEKKLNTKYWNEMIKDLDSIYITEDLKSCAIVRNFPSLPGVKYLDKFAVAREERGNFNIDILWQQIKNDHSSLFWRSRKGNVFNTWYEARSEGVVKLGPWHVFWYGMSRAAIMMALNICEEKPSSFTEPSNAPITILPKSEDEHPQENNELGLTSESVK